MLANKVIGLRKCVVGGDEDVHGNPVVTFADAAPVRVYGWGSRSADGASEPFKPGRDVVVVGLKVFAPPQLRNAITLEPVEATPLDQFEIPIGGVLYEVDGEVNDPTHGPFGYTPGVTISLKRVEG